MKHIICPDILSVIYVDKERNMNMSEEENVGIADIKSGLEGAEVTESSIGYKRMKTENKRFQCPYCKKMLAALSGMRTHQKSCAARSIVLVKPDAGEEVDNGNVVAVDPLADSDDSSLGRDCKRKKPQEFVPEKCFQCPDCKKLFINLSGLRGHQRFCAGSVPDHVLVLVKPDPSEDLYNGDSEAIDPLASDPSDFSNGK